MTIFKKFLILKPLGGRTGVTRAISTLVHYFQRKVTIISLGKNLYKEFYDEFPLSTKVIKIPFAPKPRILSLVPILWMITLLKNENILNPHFMLGAILSSFVKLLSIGRCKNIWFIYDKEEIDFLQRNKMYNFLIRFFIKINAIDLMLVLDNTVKEYVKNNLNTEKVVTIRIGIHPNLMKTSNINSNNINELLARWETKEKIFFHGIVVPRRRLEDLIASLAEIKEKISKEFILYVSGSLKSDPKYVSYLEGLIKDLGLSQDVIFLGELSDLELSSMYKGSNLFVWPCDKQTWGLAPLEAMFFGRPTIVSKGTGVSEVLNDQVAILVPPANPQILANALLKLINDMNLQNLLGNNAREYVINNLTYRNTGKRLEEIFSKLLKRDSRVNSNKSNNKVRKSFKR